MEQKTKEKKALKKILTKMCNLVGAKYKDIDFTKPGWYLDYSWNDKQEEKFRKWLKEFIISDRGAKALFEIKYYTPRKIIDKRLEYFILNYGWTRNDL